MTVEQAARPHGEFHGGTLVRGSCVRVGGDPARVGAPGHSPAAPPASAGEPGGEPRVELVRDGDVIQAIDVVCSCGQHIRLHCHYQETR